MPANFHMLNYRHVFKTNVVWWRCKLSAPQPALEAGEKQKSIDFHKPSIQTSTLVSVLPSTLLTLLSSPPPHPQPSSNETEKTIMSAPNSATSTPNKRESKSLTTITREFINILKEHPQHRLSVPEVEEKLENLGIQFSRRRLSDVINVLEGIGVIERTQIQPRVYQVELVANTSDPDFVRKKHKLNEEVRELSQRERELHELLSQSYNTFKALKDHPSARSAHADDLLRVPALRNSLSFFIPFLTDLRLSVNMDMASFLSTKEFNCLRARYSDPFTVQGLASLEEFPSSPKRPSTMPPQGDTADHQQGQAEEEAEGQAEGQGEEGQGEGEGEQQQQEQQQPGKHSSRSSPKSSSNSSSSNTNTDASVSGKRGRRRAAGAAGAAQQQQQQQQHDGDGDHARESDGLATKRSKSSLPPLPTSLLAEARDTPQETGSAASATAATGTTSAKRSDGSMGMDIFGLPVPALGTQQNKSQLPTSASALVRVPTTAGGRLQGPLFELRCDADNQPYTMVMGTDTTLTDLLGIE